MTGRTVLAPADAAAAPRRDHLLARGWGLYLLLAVALVPIVPLSAGQIVFSDPINAGAMILFAAAAILYGSPVRMYFLVPALVVLLGSTLALINAPSPVVSLVCIGKDVYLYLWFLALVALMTPRGDLRGLRLAWLWVSTLIALYAIVLTVASGHFALADIFNRERGRAVGTFYNPNMFADYLLMSLFVVLGLIDQAPWYLLVPSLASLGFAMLLTKSNGGLVSLAAGLVVWGYAWAIGRGVRLVHLVGATAVAVAILTMALWLPSEWEGGGTALQGPGVLIARQMSESRETRQQIWRRLGAAWARAPLGIGPEATSQEVLAIGEREQPGSFSAREAHDDYLAYAVERGPLGILGLLLATIQVGVMALTSRRRLGELVGGERAGSAVWAAILGGLAGTSVHSLVIEKLHFRHFWLFLALATAMAAREAAAARATDRARPADRERAGAAADAVTIAPARG